MGRKRRRSYSDICNWISCSCYGSSGYCKYDQVIFFFFFNNMFNYYQIYRDNLNFFRDLNNKLVPIMLDRLHSLHKQACLEKMQENNSNMSNINFARPFAHLAKEDKENSGNFFFSL